MSNRVIVDMDDYRTHQVENGFTRIAHGVMEDLIQAPLTARQYKMVLAVIRKTYGYGKREDRIPLSQLSELTSIEKANCSRVLKELIAMNIIIRSGTPSKIGYNKYSATWNTTPADTRQTHKQEGIQKARKHLTTPTKKVAVKQQKNEELLLNSNICQKIAVKQQKKVAVCDNLNRKKESKAEETTQTAVAVSAAAADFRPDSESASQRNAASKQKTDCPYDELAKLYCTHFPTKRQPKTLSARRKSIMQKGWKHGLRTQKRNKPGMLYTDTASGLEFWDKFMGHIATHCKFCMQVQENFDIEWLFTPRAIDNIIDGKYDTVHERKGGQS